MKDFVGKAQIDHIIPQSIGGPDIFSNKVLAHTECNHDNGQRTPYEFKFQKDIDKYLDIKNKKNSNKNEFGNNSPLINLVKSLESKYEKEKKGYYDKRKRKWLPTQKGKTLRSKINDFLLCKPDNVKDIVGDFSNLHLNSTAWINKIIMDWCKDICLKVTPSFGSLTAYLRKRWQFNNILPEVRVLEGQKLFNESGKEINSEKWQELFTKKDLMFKDTEALREDFKERTKDGNLINDTDKQKSFNAFCQEARQLEEYKFDKRCDNRHHAVDAAIIGLCTLSLVGQASKHNERWGGLYEVKNGKGEVEIPDFKIAKEDGSLYNRVKNDVKKYLTKYVVWHKPDKFPSGKFFSETAYRVKEKDGKNRLVIKQPLDKVLKGIKDIDKLISKLKLVIVGEDIKESVIEQLKKRFNEGMSLENAFIGKDEKDGIIFRGNKVKKLKVFYKKSGLMEYNEDVDYLANPKCCYQNDGYACMDFDKRTGKLVKAIPIWKFDKNREATDKNYVRFFIDDTIYDKDSKQFYRVKKFAAAKASVVCVLSSESNGKEKSFGSKDIKNLLTVKIRQDISKIKREYGK